MKNWRSILSYKIESKEFEEFEEGDRVRTVASHHSAAFDGVDIPAGVEGVLTYVNTDCCVKLDWTYPVPYDYRITRGFMHGNLKGWRYKFSELELI